MHVPVMLAECLEYLAIRPDGVYLDATCGLGGHTRAIAQKLQAMQPAGSGLVISCDRDSESLEMARQATSEFSDRIRFHQSLFSQLDGVLVAEKIPQLDGLLADLGVSRYQLTEGGRGFSLKAEGPLDMRMGRGITGDASESTDAAAIINYSSEKDLANLIYEFGEERRSRQIARAIVRARPIHTTAQLAKLIEGAVPRTGKLHPATQTFMALRIAVNREFEEIDALLESLPRLVKPGGRVVVLTYHSLEDRKIKHGFQDLAKQGRAISLTRHVAKPTEQEVRDNPPSRSAKLRALEMSGE